MDETERSVPGVLMKILSHTDPNVKIMIVHDPGTFFVFLSSF